jgi:hypothetical protein
MRRVVESMGDLLPDEAKEAQWQLKEIKEKRE